MKKQIKRYIAVFLALALLSSATFMLSNALGKSNDIGKISKQSSTQGLLDKLKADGYSSKEISQASMLGERVMSQLKEVTEGSDDIKPLSETEKITNTNVEGAKDDLAAYKDILSKFDLNTAISFMLKSNKDFGSYQKALDEYLLCLQIGVDIQLYSTDKKAYDKEKQEKMMSFNRLSIINLDSIETAVLKRIQNMNSVNKDKLSDPISKSSGVKSHADNIENDYSRCDPESKPGNIQPQNSGFGLHPEAGTSLSGIRNNYEQK